MKCSHLTTLLLGVLLITCSKEDDLPRYQTIEELNQQILLEMEKDDIPSLAACIVKDDRIVWQNTYGYADRASQTPPTEETIYLLASISKTITATAIMQLYEKGLLDLEADINQYLPFELYNPHFPDLPITTSMLLTHTSGLAWPTNEEDPHFNDRFSHDLAPELGNWLREYTTENGSEYLSSTWKRARPGERYQYSNTGAALLGYLVESITGQDFAEYCRENIFEPLEMFNSGYLIQDVDPAKLATLYHLGQVIQQYHVGHYPASTVRSSISELSHFLIAMMNGGRYRNTRILEEGSVAEMLQTKVSAKGISYIWQLLGENWIGHLGGYWGVTSSMDMHLDHDIGVILLCNTNGKESLYPDGRIYELLHSEALKYID